MRISVVVMAAVIGLLVRSEIQAASTYMSDVVADGATNYWRLGESSGTTAFDSVGSSDGTYTGGYTLGQSGALSGDADTAVNVTDTGYVDVGSLGALPTTGTIEFWMNADTVVDYRNPFSTSGAAGGNEGFRFEVNTAGKFDIRVGNDGGATHIPYTLTNSATAGEWYYVAATWDTGTNTLKAYLNGTKVVDVTHTAWPTNLADVEIGRGFSNASERSWDGLIDEVAIYNGTALSEAQVLAHYNVAVPEPSAIVLASLGALGLALIGRRRKDRRTA